MDSLYRLRSLGLCLFLLWPLSVSAEELASTVIDLQQHTDESRFYGRIEAVNQATVSAETQGRIEQIYATIGDTVTAGTVLLSMTNTEQRAGLSQAEANLADARSTLLADEAEYQRIKNLSARGFVSKADMDRATARLNTSKSRVTSAEAGLKSAREQLSYTEIKAPYNGIVSARHVELGEAVRPGTLLLSGYDPSALRVEVDLPQTTATQVAEFRQARVTPSASVDPAESVTIESDALIIYPTIDPATSTVRIRLNLPKNTPNFTPGQFVSVVFVTGDTERLLVPIKSVVYRSEVTAVYVLEGDKIQLRQIRPGDRYADQLEVLAGLSAGERIATDTVAAAKRLRSMKDQDKRDGE